MVSNLCLRIVTSLSGRRNQKRNNLLPIGDLVLLAIPVCVSILTNCVWKINSHTKQGKTFLSASFANLVN